MSCKIHSSPQASNVTVSYLSPIGTLTNQAAQVVISSRDDFPLTTRVASVACANQVFNAAGSPLPANSSSNLGKRKIKESPLPVDTPALFARLKKISEEKPITAKATSNENKIIGSCSSILARQSLRDQTQKEDDLATRMFGAVKERCSSAGDSPYTKSTKENLASDRSQWVSSLSIELWESIPFEERAHVKSSVRPSHLETAGSRGAGFHILPHTDDRWKNMMRDISLSPGGAVSASFTPLVGAFKNSSFFPPYDPSMDAKGVMKCIYRSVPLRDYKSKQGDVFLLEDLKSGLILERVTNRKSPMLATSAYPVFYFGKSGEWQTQASIPLTVDCSLGSTHSPAILITPRQIQQAVEGIIDNAIISNRVGSLVKYETKNTVVLDVARKLPGNIPQGCYVECPKTDFSKELLDKLIPKK